MSLPKTKHNSQSLCVAFVLFREFICQCSVALSFGDKATSKQSPDSVTRPMYQQQQNIVQYSPLNKRKFNAANNGFAFFIGGQRKCQRIYPMGNDKINVKPRGSGALTLYTLFTPNSTEILQEIAFPFLFALFELIQRTTVTRT